MKFEWGCVVVGMGLYFVGAFSFNALMAFMNEVAMLIMFIGVVLIGFGVGVLGHKEKGKRLITAKRSE